MTNLKSPAWWPGEKEAAKKNNKIVKQKVSPKDRLSNQKNNYEILLSENRVYSLLHFCPSSDVEVFLQVYVGTLLMDST